MDWPTAAAVATAIVVVAAFLMKLAVLRHEASDAAQHAARQPNGYVPRSEFVEVRGDVKHLRADFVRFEAREEERAKRDNERWTRLHRRLDQMMKDR